MYFWFGFFFFILEGSTCYVRTFFLGKPLSDAPPMVRYLKVLEFPYATLLRDMTMQSSLYTEVNDHKNKYLCKMRKWMKQNK